LPPAPPPHISNVTQVVPAGAVQRQHWPPLLAEFGLALQTLNSLGVFVLTTLIAGNEYAIDANDKVAISSDSYYL
jgi:hypothetical protein